MSASLLLITVCNGLISMSSGALKRIDIAMEESKELQGFYNIFRAAVYVSVLMEFSSMPLTRRHWTTGTVSFAIFTGVSSNG